MSCVFRLQWHLTFRLDHEYPRDIGISYPPCAAEIRAISTTHSRQFRTFLPLLSICSPLLSSNFTVLISPFSIPTARNRKSSPLTPSFKKFDPILKSEFFVLFKIDTTFPSQTPPIEVVAPSFGVAGRPLWGCNRGKTLFVLPLGYLTDVSPRAEQIEFWSYLYSTKKKNCIPLTIKIL